MRKVILALLTASGLTALGAMPAEAVGTRYPFCIQGDDQPGLSNCTFTSYEQCQATASGRRLWCIANPYYVAPATPRFMPAAAAPCRPRIRAIQDTERVLKAYRGAATPPTHTIPSIQRANVI